MATSLTMFDLRQELEIARMLADEDYLGPMPTTRCALSGCLNDGGVESRRGSRAGEGQGE